MVKYALELGESTLQNLISISSNFRENLTLSNGRTVASATNKKFPMTDCEKIYIVKQKGGFSIYFFTTILLKYMSVIFYIIFYSKKK